MTCLDSQVNHIEKVMEGDTTNAKNTTSLMVEAKQQRDRKKHGACRRYWKNSLNSHNADKGMACVVSQFKR